MLRYLRKAAILMMAGWLVACGNTSTETQSVNLKGGTATVAPIEQSVYFAFTNTRRANVDITRRASKKITQPVDVLLLFDRTGSMGEMIQAAFKAANGVADEIFVVAPQARIGVASLADYPSHAKGEAIIPWKLDQSFTTDKDAIAGAIGSIKIANGGDGDEAYSTALYEAGKLPWRADAKRFIVLIGDSFNHNVDPGPDDIEGTADDIHFQDAIQLLEAAKVSVLGVRVGSFSRSVEMFAELAQRTGGSVVELDDAEETPRLIQSAVLSNLMPVPKVIPNGPRSYWVRSVTPYRIEHTGAQTLKVEVKVPPGTPDGRYPLQLEVRFKDDTENKSAEITTYLVVGWINHPLVPFVPLLLLLALALLLAIRAIVFREDNLYPIGSFGPVGQMDLPGIVGVLEVIFWCAVMLALIGIYLAYSPELVLSDLLASHV